jgi:transketolase
MPAHGPGRGPPSAADLMAVLLARHLRYDVSEPSHPGNDHLIFSKGHASPLLYAMYHAAGAVGDRELLTFRKLGSRLEGHHPTPRLPWVDVATGSLGLGLPVGVGLALAGRHLEHLAYRVWVLCGDGELAEGSMWEAFEHSGYEHLDNLTAIIDVNRLGQRGETRHGWDTAAYARRIGAFGWHTIEIDGHDVAAIDRAYAEAAATADQPTAIIARTMKGRGGAAVQDAEGAHGKPVPDADEAIAELGGVRDTRVTARPPAEVAPRRTADLANGTGPRIKRYGSGEMVATRTAFGEALAAVGDAREDVVVLDGEISDSTKTDAFAQEHPDRFFEFYIAEQQIGEDGPSQMGLEDLALFRAVHGSVVLYPCDANQTAALVAEMAAGHGIGYLRTTRGPTPVIYPSDEKFPVGGSKVLRSSPRDRVTIIAAGVTVAESLRAADALAADGIPARVIDLYSVKPVDTETLRKAAEVTEHFVTVEDHWPEGGLGDAVLAAFGNGYRPPHITKLAVHTMPGSATPEEQLHMAGIDAKAIEAAVCAMLSTVAT